MAAEVFSTLMDSEDWPGPVLFVHDGPLPDDATAHVDDEARPGEGYVVARFATDISPLPVANDDTLVVDLRTAGG